MYFFMCLFVYAFRFLKCDLFSYIFRSFSLYVFISFSL